MTDAIVSEKTHFQAYIVLGIGVLAASMAAIFIRLSQGEDVPSMLIACGRLFIATLVLTPMTLRRPAYIQQIRSLNRRDFLLIGGSGMFLALHFAAWVTSLEYTTVLISVVLVTTTPIWVALLEVVFLRARLSQMIMAGLFIALVGGVIIGLTGETDLETGQNQVLGGILSIIGAVAVAGYLVIGRKVRTQLALTPYIWLVYGSAAIFLMIVLLFTGTPVTGYELAGYAWIVLLGLVPQLIGHSSFNYALAYLPATIVSVVTQLEPVFGSVAAYFIFQEIPGEGQIIGGGIIIAGVMLASLGQSRRKQS